MPEQTPGELMASSLMSFSSSSVILPVAWWPAPRNTSSMSMWWPWYSPLRLVAADDEQGRDVEAGRRHQVAGHGLVAGGEADHAVELGALDLHLDVVHDQVAARQDVGAAAAGAMNKVAGGGGAHLEGQAAGRADRLLDDGHELSRWEKQMASSEEVFTIAILGFSMSASVRPSARHCARRTAHSEEPRGKLERSVRVMGSSYGWRDRALAEAASCTNHAISRVPILPADEPRSI